MKSWYFILAFAISALVFAACDDGETNGNPQDTPDDQGAYYPVISLKNGNTWTYRKSYLNEDGSSASNPREYSIQVLRDTTVNGIKTAIMQEVGDEGNGSGLANKSDGLYVWEKDENSVSTASLLVKYPVIKGDTYQTGDGETVLVENVDVPVQVPAGTFKCIALKVLLGSDGSFEYEYFAKNIGLIKIERWGKVGDGPIYKMMTEELINKNF